MCVCIYIYMYIPIELCLVGMRLEIPVYKENKVQFSVVIQETHYTFQGA
jgi:hypothetical protein